MGNKLSAKCLQAVQAHVYHDGLSGASQRIPVQIHAAIFQVPGHEYAGLRVVAVGQRNTCIGGNAGSRRDARHDLKRDALLG